MFKHMIKIIKAGARTLY